MSSQRRQSPGRAQGLWGAARVAAVATTVVLLAGLFWKPTLALAVLWDLLIPLVPATLLLSPAIWRNVCPLGAFNMWSNPLGKRHTPSRRWTAGANAIGIVLLAVLVPARRFAFNTNGTSLAVTVLAVALAAVVLGAWFDVKAGFCNAICPVLPVERLYGQRPLLDVGNPHCTPCTLCVTGCLDVAPSKAMAIVLGRARQTHGWIATPYGAFAAAFPGFVIGYFLTANGPWRTAGSVYLTVAGWAAASYLLTFITVRLLRLTWTRATVGLSAAAVSLYYWWASEMIANRLGVDGWGTNAMRAAAFTLIATWLWTAARASSGGTRASTPGASSRGAQTSPWPA